MVVITPEVLAQWRELRTAGIPDSHIERDAGTYAGAVKYYLGALESPSRAGKFQQIVSDEQIISAFGEEINMSAAAERLGISRQAMSQRLQKLKVLPTKKEIS